MRNNMLLLISLLFIIYSCKQKTNFDYHIKKEYNKEIAKNKKVIIIKTKIIYDSFANAKWKYLEETKFYDINGLCYMKINPSYDIERLEKKLNGFTVLEMDAEILSVKLIGYDTTTFEYNQSGLLLKETKVDGSDWNNITQNIYDNWGNILSACYIKGNQPISCWYSEYLYDDNHRILQRIDSADYHTYLDLSKPYKYIYDSDGHLIEDGSYKYVLDKHFNVIEEYPLQKLKWGAKYTLNKNGDKLTKISTYRDNSNVQIFDKQITYFKYNQEDLLIEEKRLFKGKIEELYTYTYY